MKTIRHTHQLEKDVDDLDVKIGLLVHNRITLQVILTALWLSVASVTYKHCWICIIQTNFNFSGGTKLFRTKLLFCWSLQHRFSLGVM